MAVFPPPMADTPMLRQFLDIKAGYQDAILFFRLGDFYEMFLDDAKIASKELELTLTGRGKDDNRIPMCGVPFHAADTYIAKLVSRGYKVAICEQVEDPALTKGLTKREVVKVITPGTVIGQGMLDETEHNYLFALSPLPQNTGWGVSFIEVTTGEFRLLCATTWAEVVGLLTRFGTKEILVPEGSNCDFGEGVTLTALSFLDPQRAQEALIGHFRLQSLAAFGIEELRHAYPAAWAVLHYVMTTQKNAVPQITKLIPFSFQNTLKMDKVTLKNLELTEGREKSQVTETLFWVLNDTKTAMGARKLKTMSRNPLVNQADIEARLDAVESLKNDVLSREEIRESLKAVYDLERLVSRIVSDHHNPRDLVALSESIQALSELPAILPHLSGHILNDMTLFFSTLKASESAYVRLIDLIQNSIDDNPPANLRDGFVIKPGFDSELDALTLSFKSIKEWVGSLEEKERVSTGIKSLKVGFNRVFGYYIEVPQSQSGAVPVDYIRKQTLANAERYITPELKEKETLLLSGEDKQKALEMHIYIRIVQEIKTYIGPLQTLAEWVALLDSLQSLASVAQKNSYCRPQFTSQSPTLVIQNSRHPVLEKKHAHRFIPNSVTLSPDTQTFMLITGPNMAGKSTLMRQVALSVVMAQMGSFVAASAMTLSVVDQLFTRIGALDNLYFGQSTFMVEMLETAAILNAATSKSVIILDEIGRGTSTYDGMSIAVAVTEHIHTHIGARTLFATHYHELTALEKKWPRLKNFNMQILEEKEDIVFTHLLVQGPADKSYGIHVGKMAGLPQSVLKRAQGVLEGLESHGLDYLKAKPAIDQLKLFEV